MNINMFNGGHAIPLATWYKIIDQLPKAFRTTTEFTMYFGPQVLYVIYLESNTLLVSSCSLLASVAGPRKEDFQS